MIILSSLGTGPYREARYKSEHHDEVITTGVFAEALQRWYPTAQVIILATTTAWEMNGHHLKGKGYKRFHIPEAANEAEAWQLFETIASPDVLPEGESVIFDITHGLRSLPMLGFLALSYLRVVRDIKIEKVFYGALELTPRSQAVVTKCECCGQVTRQEGGENLITPVVDLTPLINLLDWAQAANRFKDTGDARLFHPLIRENHNASLNGVADKLSSLSEALVNNRTIEAAKLARALVKNIEESRQLETMLKHRPFLAVIDQVGQVVAPLQNNPDERLNLLAHHAQILWYYRRGHYVQAVGLAREWLVSVMTWQQTGKLQVNSSARGEAETMLGSHAKNPGSAEAQLQDITALWDKVTNLRNDLLHFGMRPDSNRARSTKVEERVQNILDALPAAVRPLGLELEAALEVQP